MKKEKQFMWRWLHKTELSTVANFATKFGSGRVILFPHPANPETQPKLVCSKFIA